MPKLAMKHIEIITLQHDADEVIRFLQRCGAVDVVKSAFESDSFVPVYEQSSLLLYENHKKTADNALRQLEAAAEIKTSLLDGFSGRRELTPAEYEARVSDNEVAYKAAFEIERLAADSEAEKTAAEKTRQLLEKYLPWEKLDIPMSFSGTKHTSAFIGVLPFGYSDETFISAFEAVCGGDVPDNADDNTAPDIDFEIVYTSGDMTCIALFCHKDDAERTRNILRKLGFSTPADATSHPPAVRIARYRQRIIAAEKAVETNTAAVAAFADIHERLLFLSDYLAAKIEKYSVLDRVLFSGKTAYICGYVPAKRAQALRDGLEKHVTDISVELSDPEPGEDVPVLLENNAFAAPVEDITAAYSMPSTTDVDPNPVMSFFYYLFFGLMLSDAAYGLLIAAASAAVIIAKKPEGQTRNNLLKFLYCGLSTVFWGALYGSWFGNVVYVVSDTFFGHQVSLDPIWFDPVQNPLQLLIFSLILGFVHILAGMALKFYSLCKSGHVADAFMDVATWWVVFAGIGMMLISGTFSSASQLMQPGIWTAVAGGAALLLTQGRAATSIGGKIMGGIGSLYSITGYFSDILSYSRLMALGLVTGIIATVVNTIGAIGGRSVGGVILFVLVFLFGHSINIGINALGAYVHGNRLQYVEFFSKFYEGGGKPFIPFNMKTKHFKLKEDE